MQGFNKTSLNPWLAGLGFAALMMAGCLQTEPQSTAATDTSTPATESLRLGIKATDSCKAKADDLIHAFLAAKGDTAKLKELISTHTDFVASCVEKAEPIQKHIGNGHLKLPPTLKPDSGSHCRWHLDKVGKDDSGVTATYHQSCEDSLKPEPKSHEMDSIKMHGPKPDSLKDKHEGHEMDSAKAHIPNLDSLMAEHKARYTEDSLRISAHVKAIHDSAKAHVPNLDSLMAEHKARFIADSLKISEHVKAICDSVAKHVEMPKPPEHSKHDSTKAK